MFFFAQYFPALRFELISVISLCLINSPDAFYFHCLAVVGGGNNPFSQIFSHIIRADKFATI